VKIAFLWDWEFIPSQTTTWEDGLAAALKELQNRGHEVQVFMPGEDMYVSSPLHEIIITSEPRLAIEHFNPDVVLHWADMTRRNARELAFSGIPMAVCFAGGEVLGENLELFDHVFVESQVYANTLEQAGFNNYSVAFGTNTDLFQPIEQNKAFDAILPATFALWKRHNLFARATEGLRSLAVGYIYDDHEQECWQDCLKSGVTILPHTSAQVLKYLYAASRVCVVPSRSDGGSQRTVLEAMAMNVPVIVTDSDKFDYKYLYRAEPNAESIRGYLNTLLDGEQSTNTRDYVLENWSHKTYADALELGLFEII